MHLQARAQVWGRPQGRGEAAAARVGAAPETGQSLPDVQVTFTHAGQEETDVTNGQGIVEYAGTGESTGTVIIDSLDKLEAVLDKRWQAFRPLKLLEGAEVSRFTLQKATQSTTLTDAKTHTIQIVPVLGCIYLKLVDKTARISHANCPYQIVGPEAYAGTTDENAQLRHDDVFPGAYTLTLTLDNATYATPVEVLRAGTSEPQVRKLGVVPRSVMATVRGFVFEKNKAFVMPAAIESLQEVRSLFYSTAPSEVLIVGHADTTAEPTINDPLSLDRADCARAMLLGDVAMWLDMYDSGMPQKQRWDSHEDGLMIAAMPDYARKPTSEGAVYWYQRTRKLKVDGDCGKNTRTKLIEEYMGLVGKPLEKDPEFDSTLTTHGCGEYFPLDATGQNLDPNPANPKDDSMDRRVEFFFFDAEYGIVPPPTAQNSQKKSTEYPTWRERACRRLVLPVAEAGSTILRLRLHGADGRPVDLASGSDKSDSSSEVPYRITMDKETGPTQKTRGGWTRDVIPPGASYRQVTVEWGELDSKGKFPHQRDVMVECKEGTLRERNHARLFNIGFRFDINSDVEYDLAVQAFQVSYDIESESGLTRAKKVPPKTQAKLNAIYENGDASHAPADANLLSEDDEYNHGEGTLGPKPPESEYGDYGGDDIAAETLL
jgi:outer membrane protein OmpA-like peptidoglycan-associated protein